MQGKFKFAFRSLRPLSCVPLSPSLSFVPLLWRVVFLVFFAVFFPVFFPVFLLRGISLCAPSAAAIAAPDKSRIVDLTHVLGANMPDFHVGEGSFKYKFVHSIEKDGYANGEFSMPEHYGTHIDAPSHFAQGGLSIDQIPPDKLILPCVVIDAREESKADPDYRLTIEKIKSFEEKGAIPDGAVVFLLTGWEDRWSRAAEYRNADEKGTMHFPAFSEEAAKYLYEKRHISGIGIDTLSGDYGPSGNFPVHHFLLGRGLFIVENLNNLKNIPARNSTVFLGPLRIENGTGSPARVLAVVPD